MYLIWCVLSEQKYSTDTADYGEREILLPVLHILRQFVIEVTIILYNDVL